MIYLDASALVTLITGRRFVDDLQSFLATSPDVPMGTSTVGFVETVRTLDKFGSFPTLLPDLLDQFTEILLTDEIRDRAATLPGTIRTLDAIHVASAQAIDEALVALVTYDRRMLDIADSFGLPTAAPGLGQRG